MDLIGPACTAPGSRHIWLSTGGFPTPGWSTGLYLISSYVERVGFNPRKLYWAAPYCIGPTLHCLDFNAKTVPRGRPPAPVHRSIFQRLQWAAIKDFIDYLGTYLGGPRVKLAR